MSANMLSGATYLELGLAAWRDGDDARAAACFASIDEDTWQALRKRFTSEEMGWLNQLHNGPRTADVIAALAGAPRALEAAAPAEPEEPWTGW